jgi:MFS family permease
MNDEENPGESTLTGCFVFLFFGLCSDNSLSTSKNPLHNKFDPLTPSHSTHALTAFLFYCPYKLPDAHIIASRPASTPPSATRFFHYPLLPPPTPPTRHSDNIGWIASAFFLTQAPFMLVYGEALTIARTKNVFMVAVLLFEIGSLVCAVAMNVNVLIFGRAFAG